MTDPSGPIVARDPEDSAYAKPSGDGPTAADQESRDAAPATDQPAAADGTATVGEDEAGAAPAGRWPAAPVGTPDGGDAATEAGASETGGNGSVDTTADGPGADTTTADSTPVGANAIDTEAADANAVDDREPVDEQDDADGIGEDGVDGEDGEDGEDDDEAVEPRRRGGLLTKQVQVDAKLILIITAVLALAVGAYVLGQRQGRDLVKSTAPRTTASTGFVPPKDFVTFEDKETGVKMSVPKDWTQYSTKDLDPAIRLAVGIPNSNDTVVVRVNSFSSEVTQANVGDQKNVFDQLLAAEKIEILVNQVTTLKGMPALFYVYRFTDAATGIKGYHAHYFVFQGRKMVSVIFQALPEPRYAVLAPVFDQIASTLEVAPGPPPDFLNPIGGGAATAPGPEASAPTTAPPTTG